MPIKNSDLNDIPEIFRLYKLATASQKLKFPGNQWPEFGIPEKMLTHLKGRSWNSCFPPDTGP